MAFVAASAFFAVDVVAGLLVLLIFCPSGGRLLAGGTRCRAAGGFAKLIVKLLLRRCVRLGQSISSLQGMSAHGIFQLRAAAVVAMSMKC